MFKARSFTFFTSYDYKNTIILVVSQEVFENFCPNSEAIYQNYLTQTKQF